MARLDNDSAGVDGDGAGGTATAPADPGLVEQQRRSRIGFPVPSLGGLSQQSWILIVCCVAQFMVILDLSIVNVALPSIQVSLNFTAPDLQWIVDGYSITFASFLMLGGRAADHFGHRRTFLIALLLFALASLAGGLAPDRTMLITARLIQGVGGALMAACSLTIITHSYPAGPARHRAIGLWGAMNGAGGAVGQLLGGVLTQELSWRWILLINPPIGIAAAIIAARYVTNLRRPDTKFDLAGALTLTVGQIVLVYGIVTAGTHGWGSTAALVPIVVGVGLLVLFGVIESRWVSAPLIPFKELTLPLRTANTIVMLFSAALFPMWYLSSLYLQQVLGLSPLHTGLVFFPMALVILFCARNAGKLVTRFGVRPVLGGGLIMLTAGMLLFVKIVAAGSAIAYVMIPGVLTAIGIGFSIVPSTIAATQLAKEGQAGLASGLVNTSRQIGGGIGIALLITFATEFTSHQIGIGKPVPQALADGFRLAFLIGAGFAGAALVLTFLGVPATLSVAGARQRSWRFVLVALAAVAVFVGGDLYADTFKDAPIGAYATRDTYHYVTQPGLHPPKVLATGQPATSRLTPGYILMANFYDLTTHPMVGQSGPLILDNHLQPVWFNPVSEKVLASNLSLQKLDGKPVLAWWQGVVTNTGQTNSGEDVIVNQHYQRVATVTGKDGWITTLHAMTIKGDDIWVSVNKNIPKNLSRYGGTYNGAMIDSAVQEYSLKTGKLLYSWDALKHIPLTDSYAIPQTNGFPWDAYHVNSIQLVGNGYFLVSMRNTWAAYLVDIRTGQIVWTLGGRHSSFKLGPGALFEWQHDVALGPNSTVSMFDDHCCASSGAGTFVSASATSRGLVLKLDQQTHTVTLLAQYLRGKGFNANFMGDTQPLQNGNVFVGWGSQPYFSEYSASGETLLDAVLPNPDLSYRVEVDPWVGQPLYPPVGAAREKDGKTTVYVSWNGATQVASWKLFAATGSGPMALVAWYDKAGFETAIPVRSGYTTFKLEAINAKDKAIGVSRSFGVGH